MKFYLRIKPHKERSNAPHQQFTHIISRNLCALLPGETKLDESIFYAVCVGHLHTFFLHSGVGGRLRIYEPKRIDASLKRGGRV